MHEHRTEICIIGSGPSAAVIASHAARAGRRVLILERGGFYNADHFSHHETSVVSTLFKDGGLQTNSTFDYYVLQGQCVGGSGVLSNAVAFRVPDQIHARWVNEFGFPASREAMIDSYERIETSSSVQICDSKSFSPGTFKFLDGCQKLGLPPAKARPFDKAIKDCLGCGLCNTTCPYERKRTVNLTYLPDAIAHGADLLTYAEAWTLKTAGDRVTELRIKRVPKTGPVTWETVKADEFIVCAGAINSAALLLRSRVGKHAGKWVSFNTGNMILSEFPDVIDSLTGDDMCAYYMTDDYTIESTTNPPGACAMFTPGYFREHYDRMGRFLHFFMTGVLVPMESNARVVWNWQSRLLGHEFLHYRMTPGDVGKCQRGQIMAGKILFAGGARRVYLPYVIPTVVERPEDMESTVMSRFRSTADLNSMGSAHPFGGCVVGDDPKRSTLDTDFRVRGYKNLRVADASVFPTSLAVNPMMTIMAMADFFATGIMKFPPVTLDDPPPPTVPHTMSAASETENSALLDSQTR